MVVIVLRKLRGVQAGEVEGDGCRGDGDVARDTGWVLGWGWGEGV